MTISLRQDLRADLAQSFLEDVQFQRGKYYYAIGKLDPWAQTDTPPLEDIPNTPEANAAVRSSFVYAKKISPSDVSLVIPNNVWAEGVVYDEWDHTKDLRDSVFFVVTDTFAVYKCLDNAGGAASMVKPTGTSISPQRTADGYLWKYMYTIPLAKRNKFASPVFIPVQRAISDSFYNKGAIDDVVVLSGGSGYENSPATTITLSNTTSGSGASATGLTVDGVGRITGFTGLFGGSGYTAGVRIVISSLTGSGAVINAVITGGVVTGITIVEAGIGYLTTDDVIFQVGQGQLLPIVSATTGSILGVEIIDAGIGYTSAPVVTIVSGTGTGLYGAPSAVIQTVVYQGKIVRVNILNPGQNYDASSSVTISVQGDGTGAAFTPVVYNGSIQSVIIENPGIGYSSINLSVQATLQPGGTPAVLRAVLTSSDIDSDQAVIEQTTVEGAIYNIALTSHGSGYSINTYCEVTGNGVGCTASLTIIQGTVANIEVTNPGQGYSLATVKIIDPERLDENTIPDKASAYAILSPYGGHGFDAVRELFTDTLVISTTIINEVEDYAISQDFRYYGVIKNPGNLLTGAAYVGLNALCLYKCKFVDVTGLVEDEVLSLGQNKYRVAEVFSNTSEAYLQPLYNVSTTPIGQMVADADANRTYQINQVYNNIDFDKYSGNLLFISAEAPFVFSGEQFITFKTYIKF